MESSKVEKFFIIHTSYRIDTRHNQSETYFLHVAICPNLNQGLINYALLFCHLKYQYTVHMYCITYIICYISDVRTY